MDWGAKKVISIAGGKGGIGKSSFTANLGVMLARQGYRVVLVDADLGAANLHTMVGVSYPTVTMADFFATPGAPLDRFLIPTPYPNLRLLSSASDSLAITSPNYAMNQRLFKAIQKLDTDVIIFDIAAGSHIRAIDFFSLAPIGIVMVEPLPTSLENAFLFVKNLLFRYLLRLFYRDTEIRPMVLEKGSGLQFDQLLSELRKHAPQDVQRFHDFFSREKYRMCIVANSVRDASQVAIIDKFSKIIKRYLGLAPQILGCLPFEPSMDVAISQRVPFIAKFPGSGYERVLADIVAKMPF